MMLDSELTEILKTRLLALEPGDFHFPALYGEGWDDLYIGDKVRLGREFLAAVRKGTFPGVSDTGEKKGGGRIYRKD
ncbi:DUF1413 domain-containing protein [Martelella sp. HB161492]|uniref:DUF1413 domain-containing protein n=1 Tax=Martelella sp. HB161492 TaxID=2720726 RepID=UPI001AEEE2C6|nr:DUF1413 domain-containing protein [Martelella sp. HB161492]